MYAQLPDGSPSTSRHRLSADFGLSRLQRLQWLAYNLFNNALPNTGTDARIVHAPFAVDAGQLDRLWASIPAAASPARRLCDLFWMTLPWPAIVARLGPVRALETGCGSGVYGRLLERCLGDDLAHYLGIDIEPHPDWPALAGHPRFDFANTRAGGAHEHLDGRNLIFTQSALEHFEEDLAYFRQVAAYVAQRDEPILQCHLVPSAPCLLTFPWHGVREYTPRTLSRITRLFDARTRIRLIALGGAQCNRVHRRYITWPRYRHRVDLRDSRLAQYEADLRAAILEDTRGSARRPAFYALVLATHFDTDPFA